VINEDVTFQIWIILLSINTSSVLKGGVYAVLSIRIEGNDGRRKLGQLQLTYRLTGLRKLC
jgi:hypothetical protein